MHRWNMRPASGGAADVREEGAHRGKRLRDFPANLGCPWATVKKEGAIGWNRERIGQIDDRLALRNRMRLRKMVCMAVPSVVRPSASQPIGINTSAAVCCRNAMSLKTTDESADWGDWEDFCRVVEAGSFTAASDVSGVPKSSLSLSVARLEARLGIRLMDRTTRRMRMTEAGQTLYGRFAPLMNELRQADHDARSTRHEVAGTLRIAAPYETGWLHLAPALARLLKVHRDLRVEIDDTRKIPDLLEQRYDIAFIKTDARLPDSSLVSKRVVAMERAYFAAPELIAERGLPRQLSDIESWPMTVDPDDGYWDLFEDGHEIGRIAVSPNIRTPNVEIRVRAAADGLGVVRCLPEYVEELVARGQLVRLFPAFLSSPLKVYALTPAHRLVPAKVRALLNAFELVRDHGTDRER